MDDNNGNEKIQDYGETIRMLRKMRGLSLRELADLADINHSNLWRIEKGEGDLTISTAQKIARVFGGTLSELFEDIAPLDFDTVTMDERILVQMYREQNYANMLRFVALAMEGEIDNG